MWPQIEAELLAVYSKIKNIAEAAGREFWHIAQQVFKAEEQVIMAQLVNMLKNDAISLQNAQPGISSKDMEGILKSNAQTALIQLGASLAYTGIITAVGTAMHDLSMPDTTGNAGVVS